MSQIKKYMCFEAKDGTLYKSEDLARFHNQQLDFKQYVDANPIYDGNGCRVCWEDLKYWLDENPRIFIQLLPEPEAENDD